MSRWLALYPRPWRERYGAEFEDLLEARPPSRRDQLDIVRGAIDARLEPQLGQDGARAPLPRDRPIGLLAILGGSLLTIWALFLVTFARPWGIDKALPSNLADLFWLASLAGSLCIAAAFLLVPLRHGGRVGDVAVVGSATAGLGVLVLSGGTAAALFVGFGTVLLVRGMAGTVVAGPVAMALLAATFIFGAGMTAFVAGGGQDLRLLWLLVPYGPAWILLGASLLSVRERPLAASLA